MLSEGLEGVDVKPAGNDDLLNREHDSKVIDRGVTARMVNLVVVPEVVLIMAIIVIVEDDLLLFVDKAAQQR